MKLQSSMELYWFESAVLNVGLIKEEGLCSADSSSGLGIAGPKQHERQLQGTILALRYLIPFVFIMVMCLLSSSSCRFKEGIPEKYWICFFSKIILNILLENTSTKVW